MTILNRARLQNISVNRYISYKKIFCFHWCLLVNNKKSGAVRRRFFHH